MPPMLGLQLSSPIVAVLVVSSTVDAPVRAEAAAASTPACPPPMTTVCTLRKNVGSIGCVT